jgi:PPOX class probable F420-dependent enzyme
MEALNSSDYLLLTTRRKDGREVSTPMWAAFESATSLFYMQTYAASAKVKRIRNNTQVSLTPCDSRGNVQPQSIRVPATAQVVEPDSPRGQQADRLLAQRYGLARRAIGLLLWLTRRSQRVYLVIESEQSQ